jgi:hypothetical protein
MQTTRPESANKEPSAGVIGFLEGTIVSLAE